MWNIPDNVECSIVSVDSAFHYEYVIMIMCISSQGQPDPLNSAFHLTYNMVLNLLRVEEINPEYMLERSFYQFQNNSSIPTKQLSKHTSFESGGMALT